MWINQKAMIYLLLFNISLLQFLVGVNFKKKYLQDQNGVQIDMD